MRWELIKRLSSRKLTDQFSRLSREELLSRRRNRLWGGVHLRLLEISEWLVYHLRARECTTETSNLPQLARLCRGIHPTNTLLAHHLLHELTSSYHMRVLIEIRLMLEVALIKLCLTKCERTRSRSWTVHSWSKLRLSPWSSLLWIEM